VQAPPSREDERGQNAIVLCPTGCFPADLVDKSAAGQGAQVGRARRHRSVITGGVDLEIDHEAGRAAGMRHD
jgi:hypothetical protein